MPHLTTDFLNTHFFGALGHAILNGLWVLLALCVLAWVLVMATGGTAPKNWPKKDDHAGHDHAHAHPEAHHH